MRQSTSIPLGLVEQVAASRSIDRRALACCLDVLRMADELQQALHGWLTRNGLSTSQFSILAALADQDGLSPSALARHLGVRRPTLTGLLDNLQAQGHVTRHHGATDRRRWSIHLAPSGRALAHQAIATQLEHMATIIAPLSISERSTLRKILARLQPELVPSAQENVAGHQAAHQAPHYEAPRYEAPHHG